MAQQYTRKVIRETFLQMLGEMPLDKITVKDIVLRCNINRKFFVRVLFRVVETVDVR